MIYFIFLNTGSPKQSQGVLEIKSGISEIDIVTIAYNNPVVIKYQINLIQKFITDPFTHIIVDNSSDAEARKLIFDVCSCLGIPYVGVPKHNYAKSNSHAVAMHWAYKNIIRKRNSEYFGFLDHDVFPTRPCSIIQRLRNDIYGRIIAPDYAKLHTITKANPYWSLWGGFCFLKADLLKSHNIYKISFFPKGTPTGSLDTGGSLWDIIYQYIPFEGELAKYKNVKFRESIDGNFQTDYYECLDDWVHFINLSNSYKTSNFEGKMDYLKSFLDNLSNM